MSAVLSSTWVHPHKPDFITSDSGKPSEDYHEIKLLSQKVKVVYAHGLAIRAKPSQNAKKLHSFDRGHEFHIVGTVKEGSWVVVKVSSAWTNSFGCNWAFIATQYEKTSNLENVEELSSHEKERLSVLEEITTCEDQRSKLGVELISLMRRQEFGPWSNEPSFPDSYSGVGSNFEQSNIESQIRHLDERIETLRNIITYNVKSGILDVTRG